MTDREALQQIQSIVNAQLAGGDPAPAPSPSPPPAAAPQGALPVSHVHLPAGTSSWTVIDPPGDFGVEVAGGDAPITVTVTRPDGSVAERQPAGAYSLGPAQITFPAGAGSIYVRPLTPGTYTVVIEVTHWTGMETTRLIP